MHSMCTCQRYPWRCWKQTFEAPISKKTLIIPVSQWKNDCCELFVRLAIKTNATPTLGVKLKYCWKRKEPIFMWNHTWSVKIPCGNSRKVLLTCSELNVVITFCRKKVKQSCLPFRHISSLASEIAVLKYNNNRFSGAFSTRGISSDKRLENCGHLEDLATCSV